jgi:hypothetical protein
MNGSLPVSTLRRSLFSTALGACLVLAAIVASDAASPKKSTVQQADVDWPTYEGTQGANHYSE